MFWRKPTPGIQGEKLKKPLINIVNFYLTIFLVLVSFSNALDCDVVQATSCSGTQPNKILGLSSDTNAHAQIHNYIRTNHISRINNAIGQHSF